ncbi:hypothetical protein [Gemella morbillorum]|uniref:hypothetical protein n=1 Tax=Gemella morbillorum TaxID=29391 RepID=UPI00319E4908
MIRNITIENQKIDKKNFFTIGYCPEIETQLLCVYISWIAGYDRYYKMDEGDLSLYEGERDKFYKKYKNEIKAYRTEKLIGAGALRDYDFRCLPGDILETLDKYPPFEGYHYKDEILYARIKIGDVFFSIPPVRDGKQM